MTDKIKIIKSSCFSLFCLLLALAFWYALNNLFFWREGSVINDLLLAFLLFSIFFIFTIIYLLLVDNRKIVIISSFFIVFSSLIFFLRRNGTWVGIPAIISYAASTLILFAVYNMTNKNILHDRKNSIVFHAGNSIIKAGPMFLVVFALLFSVIFYFNFPLLNSEGGEVEEPLIELVSRPFGNIINNFIPIYDFDMNVDEFIVLTTMLGLPFTQKEGVELEPLINMEEPPEEVINYLKNKGIQNLEEINFAEYLREDDDFKNILMQEIKKLLTEADPFILYEYRRNLSENWEIKIGPDERMGQVYTRLINSKIDQMPKKSLSLILIFPAVIFFGILQVSFLILNFLYAFLCWAILIIFYKAKFYHFKKIQVEKEEIEL